MRIVRPTNPPSMAVIVDTVVYGEVELAVQPSHPTKARIDVVFAKSGTVGVLPGNPSSTEPLQPALATGMRMLARLHIGQYQDAVWEGSIEQDVT